MNKLSNMLLTSSNHSAATWSESSCSSMVSESTVCVTSKTCDRLLLSPVHHATRAPFRSMQWSGFWSWAF